MKRQKGQIQPSLERITEPLTGILSIPAKDLKSNNVRHLRAARCALRGAVEQTWLGRHSGCYIGVYSTCLDSHSWPLKHCLATPVDADYIALRVILNINKMLVNLQRVLIKSLHNL